MENLNDIEKNTIKERETEIIASEKDFIYKIIEQCTPDKLREGFTNTYNLKNGTSVQLDRDKQENVERISISRDGIRIIARHFANQYNRYKNIPDDNEDKKMFDISYEIRNKS